MTTTDKNRSEISFDLPTLAEGWASAKMRDIADVVGGGTPRTSDDLNFSDDGHPWITPADLSGFKDIYITRGKRSLSDKGLKSCSARIMPKGTVMMSSRAPIGYVAIAANLICTNQGFKSFICHPDIVSEYVYFWIQFMKPQLETMGSGSTFLEISGSRAREIPILIAPIDEQKRIVAKVEELLPRVNVVRERLAEVKEILKRFRQSVLASACAGSLTKDWRKNYTGITPVEVSIKKIVSLREKQWAKENGPGKKHRSPKGPKTDGLPDLPGSWKYVSSDALFMFVTSGSRGWAKYYSDDGPIFIRIGNLDHDTVNLDLSQTQHVDPPAGAERDRTRVRGGDILISITADVGMIGLVPDGIGEAYVNQHVAISRPVEGVYRPFLAWYLASLEGGQAQFQDLQRGATKVGLGLDDIRSVSVAYPPVEEQKEIVRRVEELFKMARTIERRVASTGEMAEKLAQAILSKAFRGELVPTEAELARREHRSYESASVLLRRINRQRK